MKAAAEAVVAVAIIIMAMAKAMVTAIAADVDMATMAVVADIIKHFAASALRIYIYNGEHMMAAFGAAVCSPFVCI